MRCLLYGHCKDYARCCNCSAVADDCAHKLQRTYACLQPCAGSDVVGGTETEAVAEDPGQTAPGSWFRCGALTCTDNRSTMSTFCVHVDGQMPIVQGASSCICCCIMSAPIWQCCLAPSQPFQAARLQVVHIRG